MSSATVCTLRGCHTVVVKKVLSVVVVVSDLVDTPAAGLVRRTSPLTTEWLTERQVNQSINQSINQSVTQSVSQSVSQSINQSFI